VSSFPTTSKGSKYFSDSFFKGQIDKINFVSIKTWSPILILGTSVCCWSTGNNVGLFQLISSTLSVLPLNLPQTYLFL